MKKKVTLIRVEMRTKRNTVLGRVDVPVYARGGNLYAHRDIIVPITRPGTVTKAVSYLYDLDRYVEHAFPVLQRVRKGDSVTARFTNQLVMHTL